MTYAGINSFLLLAQGVGKAVQDAEEPGGFSGWILFLAILGIFIVPFALGSLLSRTLKLKDLSTKYGIVLLAATLGIAPFAWRLAAGIPLETAFNWGVDLAGGTNMIFEVDHKKLDESEKDITDDAMNQLVNVVAKRINPDGRLEVSVKRVGHDRVEVIVPGKDAETVEEIKRRIVDLGTLEFGILANRQDHSEIIQAAEQLPPSEKNVYIGGRIAARWYRVGFDSEGNQKQLGAAVFREVTDVIEREEVQVEEVLIIEEREENRVTGEFLTRASPGTSPDTGQPIVEFSFDAEGAQRFGRLTGRNLPAADESFYRHLAIILNNEVHSAPRIITRIYERGQIEGNFTRQEVNELVAVLKAGALELPLKPQPESEQTVSPTLGADVRTKGVWAIIVAAVAVPIFMLGYYRFAGMVAVLCLLFNLILVMGMMSISNGTMSLPGLAGLVLTIGMAVDANVLIFERIREEQDRGSSLRMAIHNGFAKALSTIVDANVTTLITAVILYIIGTDAVKGFAVTLFIGIVMSMFTALFFGRLLFDTWERKRWLRKLGMFSIVGETHWNFISGKKIAVVVSCVLIAAGTGALFARGQRNLDIDFTGGMMVTFQFEEPHTIEEVRDRLEQHFRSVSLERLVLAADSDQDAETGVRFRLRTTMQDESPAEGGPEEGNSVVNLINKAFENSGMNLRRVTLDYGNIEPIETAQAEADPLASEFAGGSRVRLQLSDEVGRSTIVNRLAAELSEIKVSGTEKYEAPGTLLSAAGVEGSGDAEAGAFSEYVLKARPEVAREDLQQALAGLQENMAASPLFEEVNTFSGEIAEEMQRDAILAILASLVAIVGYIWFRFQQITFGFAAVVALVHDVLVVLGMVAIASVAATELGITVLGIQEFKINLPMIAAFLTIVGYSLNDTIVVFDRIREVRGKNPAMTDGIVNTSLNLTLSRTLLTSLTTFLVVSILYAIGGEGIHGFAFCLVLGVIVGTYSSIYVASPVLIWLMNRPGSSAARPPRTTGARTTAPTP